MAKVVAILCLASAIVTFKFERADAEVVDYEDYH